MYDFLLTFPPHSKIEKLVCHDETPTEVAFPEKVPYQILYSMHTLKSCLLRQLQNVGLLCSLVVQASRLTRRLGHRKPAFHL